MKVPVRGFGVVLPKASLWLCLFADAGEVSRNGVAGEGRCDLHVSKETSLECESTQAAGSAGSQKKTVLSSSVNVLLCLGIRKKNKIAVITVFFQVISVMSTHGKEGSDFCKKRCAKWTSDRSFSPEAVSLSHLRRNSRHVISKA